MIWALAVWTIVYSSMVFVLACPAILDASTDGPPTSCRQVSLEVHGLAKHRTAAYNTFWCERMDSVSQQERLGKEEESATGASE